MKKSLITVLMAIPCVILMLGCDEDTGSGQMVVLDMPSADGPADGGPPLSDIGPQVDVDATSMDTMADAFRDAHADAAMAPSIPGLETPRTFDLILSESLAIQPSLAWGVDDRIAISWCGMTAEDLGIWFGIWSSTGDEVVAPFILSTANAGIQNEPKACALANGGYVVVWSMDSRVAPTNLQVRYRRIDVDGQPLDENDIRIGSDEAGNHWLPHVACDAAGGFTIVGVAAELNHTFGIFAQHFDVTGTPTHDKLMVNDGADGGQVYPAVAADGRGRTLVVWEEQPADMSPAYFKGRWLTEAGEYITNDFVVGQGMAPLAKPLVVLDQRSGDGVISGLSDNRHAVYYRIESMAVEATRLTSPTEDISYHSAMAATSGQGIALMYLSGIGTDVSVKAGVISHQYEFSEMTTLNMGSLPPYAPSIAFRNGRLATVWTERLDRSSFFLRLAVFGPE